MKKTFLLFALLILNWTFAQNFRKAELTSDEVNFIAANRAGGILSEPNETQTNKVVDLNKTIYFFEISENGRVLYRESLRRWNPFDNSFSDYSRERPTLCLKFADVAADVSLKLLEDNNWKLQKAGNSKFLCNRGLELFKNTGDKATVKQPNGLQVKLFKLIEN